MYLIFLDIDGVLNSKRTGCAYSLRGPDPVAAKQGKIVEPLLDPVAVLMIRRLCQETSAKIVISSSWRDYFSVEEFIRMFDEEYGWKNAPIIGKTDWISITPRRLGEIQSFLEDFESEYKETLEAFVVLDDSVPRDHWPNIVNVDDDEGFTYKNFLEAMDILCLQCGMGDNAPWRS
jgi:hypothetical protein